jgi:hypothetical protein
MIAAKFRDFTGANAPLRSVVMSRSARPVATAYRQIRLASERTRCAVSFFPRASIRRSTPNNSCTVIAKIARLPKYGYRKVFSLASRIDTVSATSFAF